MQSRSAAGPGLATETLLAEVLAVILRVDNVPVDSHFFNDLGADSLVMAQFCARVRKRNGLPPVTIKDVYQHPTIAALSAALVPAPSAQHRTRSVDSWPRSWPRSWRSPRFRPTVTSSTIWAPTRC